MPNDNTHTLLPCPFCGHDAEGFGQALAKDGESLTQSVRHPDNGCCLSILVFRIEDWNTRTPAEPKAGDWEKELRSLARIHCGLSTEPDCVPLDRATQILRRALSSAAPRITEQDIADAYEQAEKYCSLNPDADFVARFSEDVLALLRQQPNTPAPLSGITEEVIRKTLGPSESWTEYEYRGARRLADDLIAILRQQGAEREWISVDECDWDDETPVYASFEERNRGRDIVRDKTLGFVRMAIERDMSYHSVYVCKRIEGIMPPFTPTQTEE